MPLRRFYIPPEAVSQPHPVVTGPDASHISRTLRLTVDDRVELFDGTGRGYRARIVSASPKAVSFAIEASFAVSAESPVHITLAQGLLKDRKMDGLIRQLTELGVDCWMPFHAARSVPSPSRKGLENRLARWKKIATEAVKQCRRGRVPRIAPADDFETMLAATADHDLRIIFWEGAERAFDVQETRAKRIVVAVGPEGGFDAGEMEIAGAHGFITAGLGPRILRAETAALAAFTLVQYCFGDMGRTG
jgi:16S rRNA (uracil1498-N3)-methyltransferase